MLYAPNFSLFFYLTHFCFFLMNDVKRVEEDEIPMFC